MARKVLNRGGKKQRKYGRWARKPGNLRYKATNRRLKNKLRRILKTQGEAAVERYRICVD